MASKNDRMDTIVSLAKRRGLVFPSSEIYGGLRASWDYGPLGVELKNNVKRQWWKAVVQGRDDVVGLDSCVILAREVWETSGHVQAFVDPLVECTSCHKRFRADHLEEAAGKELKDLACPNCGNRDVWTEPKMFNGLLSTKLGVVQDDDSGLAYLRPETAQGIFINYANVQQSSRKKPPFGIGQVGKSFRNEITPGNFIFRTREFEQMEMEFFVQPGTDEEWHQKWIDERFAWYVDLGIEQENLRLFEHPAEKLSHYSKRTVDIEYRFQFTGNEWGELEGIANRTDYDLTVHSKASGTALDFFDQESGERWTPYVIEPAAGVDRCALTFLLDAYTEDEAPERQGRRRQARRAQARPAPRADQGRGAAAVAQRRPVAGRARPGRDAAPRVERGLRRRGRHRPPVPPPGRGRHAVLRHGRLRHPRGPGRDGPRARRDDAGARLAGPGAALPERQARPGLVRTLVVDHPLVAHKLTALRDERTDSPTFRRLADELVTLLAYEATREVRVEPVQVTTPVAVASGVKLARPVPLVVPVLRAGLGMLDGMTRLLPTAEVGFLGMVRDETSLTATAYANRLPDDLSGREVFVLDPMLATGGTLIATFELLLERGADSITGICLLAAPEGVQRVEQAFPDHPRITVVCAGVDERLNDKGYITPGLGDAGDRLYGVV